MRLLILVPAKARSRGLPGKNLLRVGGMSLVARAVHAAREFRREAGLREALLLVDTDSSEIAREAEEWGAQALWLRPPELAGDDTPTIDVVRHVLARPEIRDTPDAILLLQPTSPLRTCDDILRCWEAFQPPSTPSVVTVSERHPPVEWSMRMDETGVLQPAWPESPSQARRQAFATAWAPNGAVYVNTTDFLLQHGRFLVAGVTRGVVMSRTRSVDVDTQDDLRAAQLLAAAEPAAGFTVGRGRVGGDAPCFVIAEAGVNHNGDPELAHRLVEAAADSGADAVKFQTFNPELLVSAAARRAEYQRAGGGGETQLEMLRALVLPREVHADLKNHAERRGLLFLSTPFDESSADFLAELGVPAFKIGSGEITNLPLLAHVAAKGQPVLLSTGMSTLEEVARAVDTVRENGEPPLALLHCVTSYPAEPADCNLFAMETMRDAFGVPVGWSDHTIGTAIGVAAVSMGAELLEKHLTLDRSLPGPDHRASLEPDEFTDLVSRIRMVESALGDGEKKPAPSEIPLAAVARRSLHARRAIRAGEVVALRPAGGLPPSRRPWVIGRSTVVAIGPGEMLREEQFG
jgi:N-acetylneuraminate synthase/N,N'-diacetyllegionaminate synthase